MPFGQSALVGAIVGNIAQRGAYLIERVDGASPREAQSKAEEIGISAQVSAGTMVAVATADPIGGALNLGHSALRETERSMRQDGK
jgi:hypothetical protein